MENNREAIEKRIDIDGKGAFAEVIESSVYKFLAQSWQWNKSVAFGSLVIIPDKKRTIFALVCNIETGSLDPIRYPFAFQKTEEELLRDQPQIFQFLKTTFTGLVIGYQEDGQIVHLLPSQPAKIHAFIEQCPIPLARQFFQGERYLSLLFSMGQQESFNLNELLLAVIDYQISHGIMSVEKLQGFVQKLSLLLGNDYRQLKLLLQRIEPLTARL